MRCGIDNLDIVQCERSVTQSLMQRESRNWNSAKQVLIQIRNALLIWLEKHTSKLDHDHDSDSREYAQRPLERVYIDIISSSVPSIEGYNNAIIIIIIADNASMYQWVYRLKKSDANAAARK